MYVCIPVVFVADVVALAPDSLFAQHLGRDDVEIQFQIHTHAQSFGKRTPRLFDQRNCTICGDGGGAAGTMREVSLSIYTRDTRARTRYLYSRANFPRTFALDIQRTAISVK